jgi:hypothetical protein
MAVDPHRRLRDRRVSTYNVQAVDSQPFVGDSPNSFEALMGAWRASPRRRR